MAFIPGSHTKPKKASVYKELKAVKGTISFQEAEKWFAKYCMANPAFTVRLLTGVRLDPIQDIMLKSWFLRDTNLIVAGRGFSKSFTIALFIILYACFYPGTKIGITSGTFRQSKTILNQIVEFSKGKNGHHLKNCITQELKRGSDEWTMKIGSSLITAVPLGKIRGYRFNVVIMDELLQVSTEIMNLVILPFLAVKREGSAALEIKEAEDILIANGLMTEGDRMSCYPDNKMIGLSSATYKFESLYKDHYEKYVKTILDPSSKDVSHSVMRMSYKMAPKGQMDEKRIEDFKRQMSSAQFKREMEACFSDESGGFFKANLLYAATLAPHEEPSIKVRGDSAKKYILSVDPNYDSSETSDNFAMCVIELDTENKTGVVVHQYALSESTHKERAYYLRYLLRSFNIVYIVCDNAGGPKFFEICHEMGIVPEYKFIEDCYDEDDYQEGLRLTKATYDLGGRQIIHSQVYNANKFIPRANEHLSYAIEKKIIRFASEMPEEKIYEKFMQADMDFDNLRFVRDQDDILSGYSSSESLSVLKNEFFDNQKNLISQVKHECSLIEMKSTVNGNISFDLPSSAKGNPNDPRRPRRDSYAALLLGVWGMKCYFDLMGVEDMEEVYDYSPMSFG